MAVAQVDGAGQLLDRLSLIALRLVIGAKVEGHGWGREKVKKWKVKGADRGKLLVSPESRTEATDRIRIALEERIPVDSILAIRLSVL
jgi:hypothetical protein